jgi:hypothetical protein
MVMYAEALDILLADAVSRDRTTARRAALLSILLHERSLTREQLIARVEGKLGKGCFGDYAWVDTFFRDMQVVKRALRAAGYQLAYSRSSRQPGYYLHNHSAISADLSTALDGAVADADPSQIAIFKESSFAQRFQQGFSISNLARRVIANRIRQRYPHLSIAEAQRRALQVRGSP